MYVTGEKKEKTATHRNEFLFGEIELKYPKWLLYSIAMIIALSHMYSNVSSLYIMNEYAYHAIMEDEYPNGDNIPNQDSSGSVCVVNTSTVEYQQQVAVQQLTSEWNTYCTLATNIPAIILNMNIATYSDVYGRKMFFILPLVGTFLKTLLCTFGIYYKINIGLFTIFYGIEGFSGLWTTTLAMSFCLVADVTEPGKGRSIVISLIECAVGIGALFGTLLSGYLISWTNGFLYPMLITAAVVFIALIILIIFLPETLHQSRKRDYVPFCQNTLRATECFKSDFSRKGERWMFFVLIFMFLLTAFANFGRINVETLLQLNSPFCWDSVRIGWFGAIRNLAWSFGGMIMIKLFHICTTDEFVALFGCMTTIISLTIEGLANSDLMLFLSAITSIGSIATMPMSRAIMSRMTPPHKQGSVFACIAAVEVICSMAATICANAVYDATVGIDRGITFFVMAGYGVLGVILNIFLIIGQRKGDEHEKLLPTN